MQVIDLDLAWRQALTDFNARMADLEMAVGAPIDLTSATTAPSPQEEKQ
jgi:hypothetical protein